MKAAMAKKFPSLQRANSLVQETVVVEEAEVEEEDTDASLAGAAFAAEEEDGELASEEDQHDAMGAVAVAAGGFMKKLTSSLKRPCTLPSAPSVFRNRTFNPLTKRCESPLLFQEEARERPPDTGFYVGADKFLFHLGGCKYLIISQATGLSSSNRLRICELTTDPSRKTVLVRLSLQQWVDLCSWFGLIKDIIEKEKESEGSGIQEEHGQKRIHVGANVYLSLKRGLPGVDIRWFWMPPSPTVDYKQDPSSFDIQPSRYGIWLNYKEWSKLEGLRDLVRQCIPALEGMSDCVTQHLNQEGLLLCVHCNPNGHHVWI